MKNKIKIILTIVLIIVVLGIIFFTVDYNRAKSNQKPIFCIKHPGGTILDGGTIIYFGLGYKVIDYHTLAGFDDVKIGTWSMDYNDFRDEMKIYEEKFEETMGSGVVVIKNGDINNEKLIENFINTATLDSAEEQSLIIHEYTSDDEFVVKELRFIPGTYSNSMQKDETISIATDNLESLYGHYIYTIDNDKNTERIFNYRWMIKRYTENGVVNLSFQTSPYTLIDVTEMPIICSYSLESSNYTQKFDLTYIQRKDLGIDKIIDKEKSVEYDFNIYTYGGDVSITIESDMVYDLKKALEEKVITAEDILNQARIDADYGICYEGAYSDGGSVEFCYEDYTILKFNTLDGNEDLVIGMKGQIINSVDDLIE